MEKQINEKMPEIIYKVNDMILVDWSVFTIKVDEITKPLQILTIHHGMKVNLD